MTSWLTQNWRRWQLAKRQRAALHYWQKRSDILRQGLPIYADVLDCYTTSISTAQLKLVRLKLSIPIRDRNALQAISTAFIVGDTRSLVSKRLRIRFLPGDLSHVVITG